MDDNQLAYFHAVRFKQLSQFGRKVIHELIALNCTMGLFRLVFQEFSTPNALKSRVALGQKLCTVQRGDFQCVQFPVAQGETSAFIL